MNCTAGFWRGGGEETSSLPIPLALLLRERDHRTPEEAATQSINGGPKEKTAKIWFTTPAWREGSFCCFGGRLNFIVLLVDVVQRRTAQLSGHILLWRIRLYQLLLPYLSSFA